jgi:HlyD family secretion protein
LKKGSRIVVILVVIVAVAAGGIYAFRGSILPKLGLGSAADPPGGATANGKDTGYTLVAVAKGNLSVTVAASGKLQPVNTVVIRPDPNMPSRPVSRLLVAAGDRVKPGQLLAEIDPSGLDLDLASAKATYEAQKLKLDDLMAGAAATDLRAAEAALTNSQAAVEAAQSTYDSTKALVDKGLAAKSALSDAERQVQIARANLASSQEAYDTTKAGPTEDVIQAQQAAVAQASNSLQKAQLVMAGTKIVAPSAGVVTDLAVAVGDLVGPSTALMTIANMDTAELVAQVNENDIGQVAVGQSARVTPSGYPDLTVRGKVTQIDPHATTTGNVSMFNVSILVPNRTGQLLWGMNADVEIDVLSRPGVLTLPVSAVRTSNGSSTVQIVEGGKLVSWDVETGATDGSKVEIKAGLGEGDEVAIVRRTTTTTSQQGGGFGGVFRMGGR